MGRSVLPARLTPFVFSFFNACAQLRNLRSPVAKTSTAGTLTGYSMHAQAAQSCTESRGRAGRNGHARSGSLPVPALPPAFLQLAHPHIPPVFYNDRSIDLRIGNGQGRSIVLFVLRPHLLPCVACMQLMLPLYRLLRGNI